MNSKAEFFRLAGSNATTSLVSNNRDKSGREHI